MKENGYINKRILLNFSANIDIELSLCNYEKRPDGKEPIDAENAII